MLELLVSSLVELAAALIACSEGGCTGQHFAFAFQSATFARFCLSCLPAAPQTPY